MDAGNDAYMKGYYLDKKVTQNINSLHVGASGLNYCKLFIKKCRSAALEVGIMGADAYNIRVKHILECLQFLDMRACSVTSGGWVGYVYANINLRREL
jgi:hypothetical protein